MKHKIITPMKTEQKIRYRITRGDYYGTTDNRADRWYIDSIDGPVDRHGKGYRSRALAQDALAALEAGVDWSAMPQD